MERTRFRDVLAIFMILIGSFFLLENEFQQIEHIQDHFGFTQSLSGATSSGYLYEFVIAAEPKQDDIWDILHSVILTIGETMQHVDWIQPMTTTVHTRQELNDHLESSWISYIPRFLTTEPEVVILDPGYFNFFTNQFGYLAGVMDASKWSTATCFMLMVTTILTCIYVCMLLVNAQKLRLRRREKEINSNQMQATEYLTFTRTKYNAVKSNYNLKINELKDKLKMKEARIVRCREFADLVAKHVQGQNKSLHEAGKKIELLKWGVVVSTD